MAEKKTTPAVPDSLRRMLEEYSLAREKGLAETREVAARWHAAPRDTRNRERAMSVREALHSCATIGGDDAISAAIATLDRILA
jgi:hypothetical protein